MTSRSTTAAARAPRAGGRGRAPGGGSGGGSGSRGRGRLLRGLAAAVLVTGVLAGGLLVWWGSRPVPPPDAPLPSATFDLRGAGTASPVPSATGTPSVPSYGPDRLGIPSLGVDAPLVAERTLASGDLVIPGDPATVGRWDGGAPLAATAGTTLLAGHVSVAGVGDGALGDLHRIAPGALVVTTDAAGLARRWRVVALEVRDKTDLPAFPTTGPRRLAVVTCGGELLHTPQGNTYRDNVIAWADPVA